jgi:membrane associated rhomboid family serine protease
MAFGVKSNAEIAQGQWWRFITDLYPYQLLHLLFNSYALWIVGPRVERLWKCELRCLYILTGIAGVAGSYFYHPYSISTGASGAIFGLSVLLVFGFRYRHAIPPDFKGRWNGNPAGDRHQSDHRLPRFPPSTIPRIGGLLAGAVLALVVPFLKRYGPNPAFKTAQVALLLLAAISFSRWRSLQWSAALGTKPCLGLTQFGGVSSSTQQFIDALNDAQNAFENTSRELGADKPNPSAVKTDMTKAIDKLRAVPSLSEKSDALTNQLLAVLQDEYEILQDVERTGRTTFAHGIRLKNNSQRYEELIKAIVNWVDTEGQNYGIQMRKPG